MWRDIPDLDFDCWSASARSDDHRRDTSAAGFRPEVDTDVRLRLVNEVGTRTGSNADRRVSECLVRRPLSRLVERSKLNLAGLLSALARRAVRLADIAAVALSGRRTP
jgi:hypothetical protein